MASNKKQHYIFLFGILALVVGSFFMLSATAYGQATGAPGEDSDASNIPNLIRIEDPDGNGKQAKTGKLRVGSATSVDITSTFEVFGDMHIQGSFLVSQAGVCDESTCNFLTEGEKHPPFLAQAATDFVGVGTNVPTGRLVVYSSATDSLANGAIYATSSLDHGVYGVSTNGVFAGVHAVATDINMYGVYGKAVDIANRGVSGYTQTTAPAGLFYGNVLISGGFLQGNASKLYRVASVNDDSLPADEGGRGIGVWATNTVVNVAGGSSEDVEIDIDAGEVVRSLQFLVRENHGTPQAWKVYSPGGDLDISVANDTDLTILNTSSNPYDVRIIAHIETGVSIALFHKEIGETVEDPISNSQPVLFESGQLYEMRAEVSAGLSQSFAWQFTTLTPRGQICEKIGEGQIGNCLSSSSGSINGTTVYYKMPASYEGAVPPTDTLKVEWLGGVGDITRAVALQIVDIVTPDDLAVEWNAGQVGASAAADVSATAIRLPSGFGSYVENYSLVQTRGSAVIGYGDGLYTAPNINLSDTVALGTLGVEEQIVLHLVGTGISKTYSVWLVPSVAVDFTYPNDGSTTLDDAQAGNSTTTTAFAKALNVNMTISASPYGTAVQVTCVHPSGGVCNYVDGSPSTVTSYNLGSNNLTVEWTPTNPNPYPEGFVYTKNNEFFVGRIAKMSGSDGAVGRTVMFSIEGYPVLTLNTSMPVNNLSFSDAASSNQEVSKSSALTASSLQSQAAEGIGYATMYVTTGTTGTFSVRVRTTQDLREMVTATVTKSGSGCTGCGGSKPPACCQQTNAVVNPGDVGDETTAG